MSKQSLIVIDDFSPHAEQIRNLALSREFSTVNFHGNNYHGISQNQETEEKLRRYLCPMMAEALGWHSIIPRLSIFRCSTSEHKPEVHIHADNAIGKDGYGAGAESIWACVYHLSLPEVCVGGTAFWKYKRFGWDYLPSKEEMADQGITKDQALCDQINKDGTDESNWEMTGLVGMKWNRLVMYPGNLFHSRHPAVWPKDGGNNKGRLTWVCFFDKYVPGTEEKIIFGEPAKEPLAA